MKKNLFILISALLIQLPLFSQNDLQWLVMKGWGKEGSSTVDGLEANAYTNHFGAQLAFNLLGVKHPNRDLKPDAKNDIFIIYADNTFFNSREKDISPPVTDFFYSDEFANVNHHFYSAEAPILYLYLTNIYEGDDPPKNLKANVAGSSPSYDNFPIPGISPAAPAAISANHDVVNGTDITLILNNTLIKTAAGTAGITVTTGFEYIVTFNTIAPLSGHGAEITGNFFGRLPIFSPASGADVAFFPTGCGEYMPGYQSIKIKADCSDYAYINLRPISGLESYYPGDDGEPAYEAIFNVTTTTGTPFTSLREDIRSSHDPNFMRIDSICKDEFKNSIVFCHLQFENTSTAAPEHITVKFNLPKGTDKNCFEIMDWFLGNSTKAGHSTRNKQKVTCSFDTDAGNITKCLSPGDRTSCIGYINFKYKLSNSLKVEFPETAIKVTSANVFFNEDRYPIRDFEDLLDPVYDGNGVVSYQRPLTTAHHPCTINCYK